MENNEKIAVEGIKLQIGDDVFFINELSRDQVATDLVSSSRQQLEERFNTLKTLSNQTIADKLHEIEIQKDQLNHKLEGVITALPLSIINACGITQGVENGLLILSKPYHFIPQKIMDSDNTWLTTPKFGKGVNAYVFQYVYLAKTSSGYKVNATTLQRKGADGKPAARFYHFHSLDSLDCTGSMEDFFNHTIINPDDVQTSIKQINDLFDRMSDMWKVVNLASPAYSRADFPTTVKENIGTRNGIERLIEAGYLIPAEGNAAWMI